jgi:hypothetical protein
MNLANYVARRTYYFNIRLVYMYRSLAMERGFFVSRLEEILKLTRMTGGGGGIGEGGIFSKTAPKK